MGSTQTRQPTAARHLGRRTREHTAASTACPRSDEEPKDVTEQHEAPSGASKALRPTPRVRKRDLPAVTVTRLAVYLPVLAEFAERGPAIVSSEELAVAAGVSSATLRKDLSFVGATGVRGVGYNVTVLRKRIEDVLGPADGHRFVLVGAGNLGATLVGSGGFRQRGFALVGIFDDDPAVVGRRVAGLVVQDLTDVPEVVPQLAPTTAVLAVPDDLAQPACDELVAADVHCLLSFCGIPLKVPPTVEVRRVDLALEMQLLSWDPVVAQQRSVVVQ